MRRRLVAAVAALALVVTGCSGDDSSSDTTTAPDTGQPLRIEAMPAAVEALEAELGGAQRYFEVNATPTLVNLFVAGDGTATAYVYDVRAGVLGDPAEPLEASGNTFEWSQVDYDEDSVLREAVAELPDALPRTFAVTAASEDALQYLVTLESRQGGVLDVLVDQQGTVLGAQAR